MWPIYYKDKLHIANTNSNVGVVTLWTPNQVILPKIDQQIFSLGGQLYSKRGVNFIVRNILANPIIDTLIICGANLSGSAETLMNLIDKGIDESNNVVDVEKSPMDLEITKEAIELFRKNVKYVNLIGNSAFKTIEEEIAKHHKNEAKPWTEPQVFPDPEPVTADKFPSEKTTFTIRAGLIKEAWPQILRHVMKFGSKKGMIKVGEVQELTNIVTVIEEENPYKPEIPDWFNFNHDELKEYYKNFFSKEAESEDYNYGERIFSHPLGVPNQKYKSPNNTKKAKEFNDNCALVPGIKLNQIEEVYLKLKNYKYDRGAIISLWNPWVDNVAEGWMADTNSSKAGNVPCMTQLQFAYREHKLHLTAYFRSNDMFDAWPRNAFALRKLQFDLAKKLDMKPGFLTTISSLGQIYEPNFDEAKKILEKSKNITNCRPDQRGNVVIEVEGMEIVAKHMDTSGNEVLQEFRIDASKPNAAQRMSDLLLTNLVFSELPHAMDIGRQLQKAELAIRYNLEFVQDRDLVIGG